MDTKQIKQRVIAERESMGWTLMDASHAITTNSIYLTFKRPIETFTKKMIALPRESAPEGVNAVKVRYPHNPRFKVWTWTETVTAAREWRIRISDHLPNNLDDSNELIFD